MAYIGRTLSFAVTSSAAYRELSAKYGTERVRQDISMEQSIESVMGIAKPYQGVLVKDTNAGE